MSTTWSTLNVFKGSVLCLGLVATALAMFYSQEWISTYWDRARAIYFPSGEDSRLGFGAALSISKNLPVLPVTEMAEDRDLQEKYAIPYLDAFKAGMDHFDIAEKVFKVKLQRDPNRTHSYPLITGNTFSSFADVSFHFVRGNWITVNKTSLESLGNGAVIYTRTQDAGRFMREILPGLPNISFVLVTAKDDLAAPLDDAYDLLKEPRLIRWFTENLGISHPKMEAIPIGLRNYRMGITTHPSYILPFILKSPPFFSHDQFGNDNRVASRGKVRRPNLVYMNFNVSHNPSRMAALAALSDIAYVEIPQTAPNNRIDMHDHYLSMILKSKFMVSPIGIGMDCYRTWEAIALGAIPIVENSTLNPLHEQGPVLIIDKWDKSVISKEFLLKYNVKVRSRLIVTADYWFDKINRATAPFLDK